MSSLSSSYSANPRRRIAFRHDSVHGEHVLRNVEWDVIVNVWTDNELVLSTDDVVITKGIMHPQVNGSTELKLNNNGEAVDSASPNGHNAEMEDVGLFFGTISSELTNAQDYLKGGMWQNRSVLPHVEVVRRDADPTPWYQIDIKSPLGVALDSSDLSLLIVLQGKTAHDSVQWTCKLNARNHNNMPFERNSPTSCHLDMNCEDGFHSAVSYYNYLPRTWTGICIKIYSTNLERVFQ